MTYSLVAGGGGSYGIAYGLGVVHGLADGGVDLRNAPALGTSAGSWVASALACDVGFDDFDRIDAPRLPDRRRGALVSIARDLFGDARSAQVRATAFSLRTGRRRILSGERCALADLVAASSAVPALLAPHRIGRHTYVDGGVVSGTAADRALPADTLIVVAPIGGRVLGPVGRAADVMLGREIAAWRRRNVGSHAVAIRPNRTIARMAGPQPMALFDADLAKRIYPFAREQGQRWAERILGATDLAA
jgi:NTE family protein